MNTIERAMGRRVGDGEAEDKRTTNTASAPDSSPRAEPVSAPTLEETPPKPVSTAESVGSDASPPGTEFRPATETTTSPSAPDAAAEARHASPVVSVDFERLAHLGYLVPGQEADSKSEEFQRIKRRILGNMVPGMMQGPLPSNLIMVTSSVPGEGKTFTSLNLAVSMAMEIDRTVLLIDTDILKADLSRLFGAQRRLGLFNLLSQKDLGPQDVLLRTNIPKLVLLPCGMGAEIATERLASEAMRQLADELARRYPDRIIIFDCPPVLAATGAAALAEHVGQVIMVVEAGKTTHEILRHALDALDQVKITGLVFNKSKQSLVGDAYGYGYYGQTQRSASFGGGGK